MNRKKILAFFIAIFCLFVMPIAHADVMMCDPFDKDTAQKNLTEVKAHYPNKQAYAVGEKVYLDLKGVERDKNVDIAVLLRSTDTSTRKYYQVYLKNIIGSDETGAYFIVPDDPEHMPNDQYEIYAYRYSKQTDEIREYGVTPDGERSPIYKVLCSTYYTNKDETPDDAKSLYIANSNIKFVTTAKKAEVRDILTSVTAEKNYTYFGGKLTLKVTTTEPVKNAYLTFVDRTKATDGKLPFFTVNLISDGTSNEFTYTVNAPTYGINNVYEGTYKLEEIILYDTNGSKLTYNTNKEKAEEYNDKYKELSFEVLLGKPITDIVKESQFELKGVKLIKNEAKVGDKVTVEYDWYYNSTKIRMNSTLLTFTDETTGKTFSTYLKANGKDSSIIIPSSVEPGEYTLKTVTITFDSYVGETNTIIIDKDTIEDAHKSIFDQKLKIVENKDAGLYFIAEELYETSYSTIKNAKDNAIITINANEKSVLPAELFDAIKESSKQLVIEYNKNEWVFSGKDIEESKPIDVSMKFYDVDKLESDKTIKAAVGDAAVVIEFPENGDLPGKALIRIKDDEIFSKLKGNVYYVYHIDEKENKLNKVAMEIQKSSNGYIEFYINHNSKYVVTDSEIKESSVIGKDDEVIKVNATTDGAKQETASKDNNMVLYIALGASLALILVLIVIIIKSKKGKTTKVEEAKPVETPVEEAKVEETKTEETPVEEPKPEEEPKE